MVNFQILWSDPYPFQDKDGVDKFRRHWVIPMAHRSSFFNFWKAQKYRLWADGFSVAKQDTEWVVYETKMCIENFKDFKGTEPPKPKEEEFWLPPYKVKNESGLRPWQVESVSRIVSSISKYGCSIDGSDLGVGKTYVACAVARELNMKIVVVCPKSVREPWRRIITDHFGMKDKIIDIINYEQLKIGKKESKVASYILNRKTHREKFIWKITRDTLIIWDESQKLKNFKTKNSKTCIEAFKQGYKMLFCSATNATNPLELRTVGTVLGLFKGSVAYYQWCYEHGVSKGRFGLEFTTDMVIRAKVLKKLHNDIFINRGVRLSRDTIPGFPESEIIADCYNMDDSDVKKINVYHNEMEAELKRLKAQIKRDTASQFTAILRARQKIELQKVPLFIDMIEEGIEDDMAVVVFLNFTDTVNAIAERLNTDCIFDGKVGDKERQQSVDDFQDGKEKVILVNIQSGGAGLSLHDIHGKNPRLSLISPSYSAVLMRQATGRVWRDSSKSKSVQKIVFVAGTVEEDVCKNVQEKLKNLDLLNDGDLKYEALYEIKTEKSNS
jgi:superfamily II DNA or RNA helicase